MDEGWRIELLGGLRCTRGARVVSRFRSHKIAALLAYLALHGERPRSRGELAFLLWPDEPGKVSRANLRVALASLRRQLEPPDVPAGSVIVAPGRTHVGLNPAAVRVDVAEFDRALHESRRPGTAPGDQAALLEKAVRLYNGPLLPGFDAAWADDERARLEEAYREALRRLAAHGERAGDWGAALDHARRAVAADPFDEEAHADLMRLLAVAGQPDAALRQYETLKRVLEEECGDVPAPAVRALAERIQKDAGPPSSASPAPPPLPAPPTAAAAPRLPPQLTRFFGREAEIREIAACLRPPEASPPARLLTLTGLGGSGKTRLAIEAAVRLAPLFGGRVFFVPLADVADAGRIADAVLDALGRDRRPGVRAMDQVVEALTSAPPCLLVLDNFEHLADAGGAPLLADLLRGAPEVSCLVTSRQRLLLEAERELPVPPLPTPTAPEGEPERLMDFAAVALFVDRAQHARPDFQITPRNARAVAELCARLEGLPLALLLAAAWAQTLTPAQMLALLDRRLDLLVSRRRDLPPRHRSLRAALEGSVSLLCAEERRLLARLWVFRGGATVAAVEAVCREPRALALLARLRERSLLLAEEAGDEMRFRMLETVRAFAGELLRQNERAALERRHEAHFVALAETGERELRGGAQAAWLARLEREHENFRAILERRKTAPETALRLAGALGRFWFVRGHWAEGRDRLQETLAAAHESGGGDDAKALLAAGTMAWVLDEYEAAATLAGRSLSRYRERGDRAGMAFSLALLGRVTLLRGEYERAAALLDESVARFRGTNDRWGLAHALDMRAFAARDANHYEQADALHAESLALRRALDDHQGIAASISNLGDVAQMRGDRERADALHGASLVRFREVGDKSGIAYALCKMGFSPWNAARPRGPTRCTGKA